MIRINEADTIGVKNGRLEAKAEKRVAYQQKTAENKSVLSEEEQKKFREKEEKEQASLKKMHRIEIKVETICLNVVWIIGTLVSLWSAIRYLIMPERTAHDNEQMVLSILSVAMFVFLIWLTNWGGDMLMDKFLAWVAEIKEKKSIKEQKKIKDLNAALHALSQKNGVVIWDTLWTFPVFFFTFGLLFFQGGNTPLILGIIVFSLVMLFGGHYVGTRIWNRHKYEKRLLKYTKQYLDIVDEQAYLKSIDESIQRGVLGFSGLWLLTDEYVVGRLSDIAFQVVAIPRQQLTYCTFFFLKRMVSDSIPVGVLQCHLKGGVDVDMEIGRGDVCNQVLRMLNTYKIPWEKKETKFT